MHTGSWRQQQHQRQVHSPCCLGWSISSPSQLGLGPSAAVHFHTLWKRWRENISVTFPWRPWLARSFEKFCTFNCYLQRGALRQVIPPLQLPCCEAALHKTRSINLLTFCKSAVKAVSLRRRLHRHCQSSLLLCTPASSWDHPRMSGWDVHDSD